MAQTIVLTNQKGGVGKTTTSAALAAGLAKKEKRVLAIDLDPQGNLGFSFGLDIENGNTLFEAFKGDVPIYDAIQRKNGRKTVFFSPAGHHPLTTRQGYRMIKDGTTPENRKDRST